MATNTNLIRAIATIGWVSPPGNFPPAACIDTTTGRQPRKVDFRRSRLGYIIMPWPTLTYSSIAMMGSRRAAIHMHGALEWNRDSAAPCSTQRIDKKFRHFIVVHRDIALLQDPL